MAITVGGTSITFNDGTTQTTAAGTPTTAQVLSATAGASVGEVGTYATLLYNSTNGVVEGSTYAGSTLRYGGGLMVTSNNAYMGIGGTPAGTWRAMGRRAVSGNCGSMSGGSTLFLRIS